MTEREHNTNNNIDCWCEPKVVRVGKTNIYVHDYNNNLEEANMVSKEELIEKMRSMGVDKYETASIISEFILADRKRIVEPILGYKNMCGESGFKWPEGMSDIAIEETLKNAGIQHTTINGEG